MASERTIIAPRGSLARRKTDAISPAHYRADRSTDIFSHLWEIIAEFNSSANLRVLIFSPMSDFRGAGPSPPQPNVTDGGLRNLILLCDLPLKLDTLQCPDLIGHLHGQFTAVAGVGLRVGAMVAAIKLVFRLRFPCKMPWIDAAHMPVPTRMGGLVILRRRRAMRQLTHEAVSVIAFAEIPEPSIATDR